MSDLREAIIRNDMKKDIKAKFEKGEVSFQYAMAVLMSQLSFTEFAAEQYLYSEA